MRRWDPRLVAGKAAADLLATTAATGCCWLWRNRVEFSLVNIFRRFLSLFSKHNTHAHVRCWPPQFLFPPKNDLNGDDEIATTPNTCCQRAKEKTTRRRWRNPIHWYKLVRRRPGRGRRVLSDVMEAAAVVVVARGRQPSRRNYWCTYNRQAYCSRHNSLYRLLLILSSTTTRLLLFSITFAAGAQLVADGDFLYCYQSIGSRMISQLISHLFVCISFFLPFFRWENVERRQRQVLSSAMPFARSSPAELLR